MKTIDWDDINQSELYFKVLWIDTSYHWQYCTYMLFYHKTLYHLPLEIKLPLFINIFIFILFHLRLPMYLFSTSKVMLIATHTIMHYGIHRSCSEYLLCWLYSLAEYTVWYRRYALCMNTTSVRCWCKVKHHYLFNVL